MRFDFGSLFLETVLEVQVKACSSRNVYSSIIAFLFENPADAAVLNDLTFFTGVSSVVINSNVILFIYFKRVTLTITYII